MLGNNIAVRKPAAASITVAHVLMAGIVGIAALLRLHDLDALPLSSAEAVQALAPFQFISPKHDTVAIGSPAYFSLSLLIQSVFGFNDVSARIVPAFFGIATVSALWALRHLIGTVAVLIASILLALSPLHTAISRTAGGDAIALFCIVLLLATLTNTGLPDRRRWTTIGAAAGLGLASSPLFFSGVLVLAVAIVATQNNNENAPALVPSRSLLQHAGIACAITFLGSATLFLWVPAGIGATANLFSAWFAQIGFGAPIGQPLLIAARYELFALLAGNIALLSLIVRPTRVTGLLASMLLIGLIVSTLMHQNGPTVLLWIVPLYLALGIAYDRLLSRWQDQRLLVAAAAMSMWGIITLVNVGRFTRTSASLSLSSANLSPLLIAALIFCAIGFAILIFAQETGILIAATLLGLLSTWCYVAWGTAWSLTHESGNDAREYWVSEGTDQDIRLLRNTLEESSYQLTSARETLEIVSSVETPALEWYLRDFASVSFNPNTPRSSADAIIVPEGIIPSLTGLYGEASFDLATTATVRANDISALQHVRWWFFQEAPFPAGKQRITVWLRSPGQ